MEYEEKFEDMKIEKTVKVRVSLSTNEIRDLVMKHVEGSLSSAMPKDVDMTFGTSGAACVVSWTRDYEEDREYEPT